MFAGAAFPAQHIPLRQICQCRGVVPFGNRYARWFWRRDFARTGSEVNPTAMAHHVNARRWAASLAYILAPWLLPPSSTALADARSLSIGFQPHSWHCFDGMPARGSPNQVCWVSYLGARSHSPVSEPLCSVCQKWRAPTPDS